MIAEHRTVTCAEAITARDGKWLMAGGLMQVRRRSGSEKGVMFIIMEDEAGVAKVVVWPTLFERSHRVMLGARSSDRNAGKCPSDGLSDAPLRPRPLLSATKC